tara:strand:+ start:238 stop:510 length:273 start_codon:yes stop_codon:yes gene_type:complete
MGVCSFCEHQERESFWKSYCEDCAMLRRMLVLHDPKKCVEILKRCLIRNEQQITNKIHIELKTESNDQRDYETPKNSPVVTRSKKPLIAM